MFRDFGEEGVGQFGVVDYYWWVSAVDYEGLYRIRLAVRRENLLIFHLTVLVELFVASLT